MMIYTFDSIFPVFFFNDTATTEIYTLSLHDALPIYRLPRRLDHGRVVPGAPPGVVSVHALRGALRDPAQLRRDVLSRRWAAPDRKSTRLNSSHANISYAVFCLKKKNIIQYIPTLNYA